MEEQLALTSGSDKAPTTSELYAIDAATRTVEVDYSDKKFKLQHDINKADDRELVKYYLDSPAVKANSKGEVKNLGMPDAPAAALHDEVCSGLRRLDMEDKVVKTYTLEQIRRMGQTFKSEGILSYIGGYYDVELEMASGDLDDLLFDRDTQLVAVVKTRPDGNKVDKTFKIILNRLDDLTLNRFKNHSHSTSMIDEKQDKTLMEYIGEENLAAMTGDEDEGRRVAFTKTTQYIRQFIDTYNKSFESFENATFNGEPYSAKDRNAVLAETDPVLKVAIAFAVRNFI